MFHLHLKVTRAHFDTINILNKEKILLFFLFFFKSSDVYFFFHFEFFFHSQFFSPLIVLMSLFLFTPRYLPCASDVYWARLWLNCLRTWSLLLVYYSNPLVTSPPAGLSKQTNKQARGAKEPEKQVWFPPSCSLLLPPAPSCSCWEERGSLHKNPN